MKCTDDWSTDHMIKSHAITFGRLHTWTLTFYHDRARDAVSIRAPWRGEGVWVDLPDPDPSGKNGLVQVMVDPATGEAAAFKVPDFRRFLARHLDLQVPWGQVKPSPIALRRMENTPFIAIFLELMERLAYDGDLQMDTTSL